MKLCPPWKVNKQDPKCTFLMSLSMSVLLILSCGLSIQSSFHQFVLAQPLITNISNKGIYKVQLGLSTGVSLQSLPDSGFSPYIRFMSATAPPATSHTIPNRAAQNMPGGTTVTAHKLGRYNVPGSILRIVPIKSFDMTIYDSHGKVLWKAANQIPSAGLKLVHVVFPNGTSGHIAISIYDIKSSRPNVPPDSVVFGAKVV